MEFISGLVIVLCSLVCLAWTSRHLMIFRERRSGFILDESFAPAQTAQDPAPFLSVIVAAKDEAANIETCVRTMLSQDYPNFELIVCNDRSADDTAAIVQRVAQENPRLKLINITELPSGWCGKNNAMRAGIAAARSEWICMIDADCRQLSAKTLSVAMRYAQTTRADLLSVLPVLEMTGFWENIVQPVCSGVMMIWFLPDKVNNPAKKNAYANGAFMLMRRSVYDAIGGHEAVKDQVNEDMHMAARVKQAGHRLVVVRSTGLYVVRMYTSLKAIVRGWGRIFFGTFGTLPRLTASLTVLVVMGLLPYAAAAAGLAIDGPGLWRAMGWMGLLAALMQVSVIYRYYDLIGGRKHLAWTYPLGCGITMYALLIALSKLRKGAKVVWRNTAYPRG